MWAFVKSVMHGTAVASALPLVFTVVLAVSSIPNSISGGGSVLKGLLFMALLAASPICITFPVVLAAGLVFGLPIAAVLRSTGWESLNAYVLCGLLLGAMIPVTFLVSVQWGESHYFWLPLLGAVSGAVTANTWWRETCNEEVG